LEAEGGSRETQRASGKHPGATAKSAKTSLKRRQDAKIAQEGAKMAIWRAKTGQEGAMMATWRPFGSYLRYFGRSCARSLPRRPKCKIEHPYDVFGDFSGPGRSGWRFLEAILDALGLMLGLLG